MIEILLTVAAVAAVVAAFAAAGAYLALAKLAAGWREQP